MPSYKFLVLISFSVGLLLVARDLYLLIYRTNIHAYVLENDSLNPKH